MPTLSARELEELRGGITEYFKGYYSEVRHLIRKHDADDAVPSSYQGYKRVLTTLGADGIVIIHWDASRDSFEFDISRQESVEELIARQTGYFPGGSYHGRNYPDTAGSGPRAITIEDAHHLRILPHTAGRDFGAVTNQEPVKVPNEDGTLGITAWTRLDAASTNHLYAWTDVTQARTEAQDHLSRYLG
jgi:hypothetical protein